MIDAQVIADVLEDCNQIATAAEVEEARSSLLRFITYTYPDYQTNWHHALICRYCMEWAFGDCRFLIIETAPRHGKSEIVSRRLPAWVLGIDPDSQLIACSYGADLSGRMNRDVQRIIDDAAYSRVFPETKLSGANVKFSTHGSWARTTDFFEVVDHRGCYRSAGVGGGITGMGFTHGIIDDPIKSMEEAQSETYRKSTWEWFTSTFFSRMEKNARILVTATRWHEDDLTGMILNSKRGKEWTRLSLPAIKEPGDNPEDPRAVGEALWPDKYSVDELQRIRDMDARFFASLYQQRPAAAEGNIYKREWWKFYEALPKDEHPIRIIHSWDTAFKKKKTSDKSACIIAAQYAKGIYLLRVYSGKIEFPELVNQVLFEYNLNPCHSCLIEDEASGQSLIQVLKMEDGGARIPIEAITPSADKVNRAKTCCTYLSNGNIYLPVGEAWTADFIDTMAGFPDIKYKDVPDAFSQLINWILTQGVGIPDVYSRNSSKFKKFKLEGW